MILQHKENKKWKQANRQVFSNNAVWCLNVLKEKRKKSHVRAVAGKVGRESGWRRDKRPGQGWGKGKKAVDVPSTETWRRGYVNRLWHTQREERLTEGLFIRCGQSERKQCRMGKYSGTRSNGKTWRDKDREWSVEPGKSFSCGWGFRWRNIELVGKEIGKSILWLLSLPALPFLTGVPLPKLNWKPEAWDPDLSLWCNLLGHAAGQRRIERGKWRVACAVFWWDVG